MRAILNSKYRVKNFIGSGGFGTVYSGRDVTENTEVAIKIQTDPAGSTQILNECSAYEQINGATGFPYVHEVGCENDRHFIVMELLGPPISRLFSDNSHIFSMSTVLMLADQMLARVEYLHQKGLLHRDIKPSNFLMGLNSSSNEVYLIDFGLATPFGSEGPPVDFGAGTGFLGTPCYASINVQSGVAPSRRDDLESLGYVLVHLATGSLPWRDYANDHTKGSFTAILETKIDVPIAELCAGLPREFQVYMESVRGLAFEHVPDYAGYRRMFRGLFEAKGFVFDYRYDWEKNVRGQLSFNFDAPRLILLPPRHSIKHLKSLSELPCHRARRGRGSLPSIPRPIPNPKSQPPRSVRPRVPARTARDHSEGDAE
jgi:serine/threonine protein kinase